MSDKSPTPAAETAPSLRLSREALITIAMGLAFAVIWSSAFSVAKILVSYTPPFAVSALRFLCAGLIAMAIAAAMGQGLPKGRGAWERILLLGLCQNTLYLGLFFVAMTMIPAGLGAIVASSMPLVVAALAPLLIKERVGRWQLLGLIMGFAGVLWIMADRTIGGVSLFGLGLTVVGVLSLSVATLTVKRGDFGTGILMVVACQMLVGAAGCVPLALIFEDVTAFTVNWEAIGAFAYAVLMPGIVATFLWFALVQRLTAAGASSFHFLNPLFGVGFAWLLLHEPLSYGDILGVVLIAAGIVIVDTSRAKRTA